MRGTKAGWGMGGLAGIVPGIVPGVARAQDSSGALPWPGDLPGLLLALAVLVLAVVGASLVWQAFKDDSSEGFSLRWQVGGFGGPGRGWRLSTPLARLLAGLVLVALAVVLSLSRVPVPAAAKKEAPEPDASHALTPAHEAPPAASAASR